MCFCFCEEQCALSLLNKLRFNSWNWVQFRLMVGELIMSMIVVTTSLEQLYHQPTDRYLPGSAETCYSFLCGNKILSKPLTSRFLFHYTSVVCKNVHCRYLFWPRRFSCCLQASRSDSRHRTFYFLNHIHFERNVMIRLGFKKRKKM